MDESTVNEPADMGMRKVVPEVTFIAPWLVIAPPDQSAIRIDLRLIESVSAYDDDESQLVLTCGELAVSVFVREGRAAVTGIVTAATEWINAGHTRSDSVAVVDVREHIPAVGMLVVLSSNSSGQVRSDDKLAGANYELSSASVSIGRTGDNEIVIDHPSISRKHARIAMTRYGDSTRYSINDLHASNGVRVNGERCIGRELNHLDVIDLGHVRMQYVAPSRELEGWVYDPHPDLDKLLFVGTDAVVLRDDRLVIGSEDFDVHDVIELAARGANLALGPGRALQAAIALLVIAASDKAQRTTTMGAVGGSLWRDDDGGRSGA